MNPHVFTLKCDSQLDRIITPLQVNRSESLCKLYGLARKTAEINTLWDTGATGSCISRRVAEQLELDVIGHQQIGGVGGKEESDIFIVDIKLPNEITVGNIIVSEFKGHERFDAILGMDIITLGDITLTNYNKKTYFTFAYPPAQREG
jgi:hypothetical protein